MDETIKERLDDRDPPTIIGLWIGRTVAVAMFLAILLVVFWPHR